MPFTTPSVLFFCYNNYMEEDQLQFLDLEFDENNSGSVRRLEEGFHELNSIWILGFNTTRYRYGTWILTVHFNPVTTDGPSNPGGKNSVTIYGVETRTILEFKNSASPGKFYIDNFAYIPNASGHGGGAFQYATSELNAFARQFINEGTGAFKDYAKDMIPGKLREHIEAANKYQRMAKNPKGLLRGKIMAPVNKLESKLGLSKFFKMTKEVFSIGVDIGEAIVAPEAVAMNAVRKIGTKSMKKAATRISRTAKNKAIKKML